MRAVAARLDWENYSGGFTPTLLPLATAGAGEVSPTLYVLLGAAGFVLLIACANVASLQLARAHARSKEFAVRAALGSGRMRIARQLLIESLILGLLGCGAGVLLGCWALGGLQAVLPAGASRMDEVSLDRWGIGFAVVASLLASVLSGLVPAFHAGRQDVREGLAQESRAAGSTRGNRWRAGLIIGECALTSALLVGAGLMIRTLGNLYRSDPGFKTERLLTFNWVVRGGRYDSPAVRYWSIHGALERLAAVPGVAHVGIVDPLPFEGRDQKTIYLVRGKAIPGERGPWPSANYGIVGGDWLGALGVKLIAGRAFDARDDWRSTRVVMVDHTVCGEGIPWTGSDRSTDLDWQRTAGARNRLVRDRRSRRAHKHAWPWPALAPADLLPYRADDTAVHGLRGAHRTRAGGERAFFAGRAARACRRPVDGQRAHDGPDVRLQHRQPAARSNTAGSFCGAGASAGGRGALRCSEL